MNWVIINPDVYRSSGVTTIIREIHGELANRGESIEIIVDARLHGDSEKCADVRLPVNASFRLSSGSMASQAVQFAALDEYLVRMKVDFVLVFHRRILAFLEVFCVSGRAKVLYWSQLNYRFSGSLWMLTGRSYAVAAGESVAENVQKTTRSTFLGLLRNPTSFPGPRESGGQEFPYTCNVLFVARLESVKNHEFLIKAWALVALAFPDWTLTLVGEGSLRDRLERLIAALGLYNKVALVGYRDDIPSLISKCSFCVLPSFNEGLPLVVVEAAKHSKATLLSNAPGTRDGIRPGCILPNGIDPTDLHGWRCALEFWMQNPDLVVREGCEVRAYFERIASCAAVATRLMDLAIAAKKYDSVVC